MAVHVGSSRAVGINLKKLSCFFFRHAFERALAVRSSLLRVNMASRAPRNAVGGGGGGGHGGGGLRALPVERGAGCGGGGHDDPYGGDGPSPADSMFGLDQRVPITKKPPLQVRVCSCVCVVACPTLVPLLRYHSHRHPPPSLVPTPPSPSGF